MLGSIALRTIGFLLVRVDIISLSKFCQNVPSTFRDDYDIPDNLEKEQDAIKVRSDFIQKPKPPNLYLYSS